MECDSMLLVISFNAITKYIYDSIACEFVFSALRLYCLWSLNTKVDVRVPIITTVKNNNSYTYDLIYCNSTCIGLVP